MDVQPKAGEIWKHYRTGNDYEILFIGQLQVKDEGLDLKECVVYRSKVDGKVWVRPLVDFTEIVDVSEQRRFSKVE